MNVVFCYSVFRTMQKDPEITKGLVYLWGKARGGLAAVPGCLGTCVPSSAGPKLRGLAPRLVFATAFMIHT